MIVRQFDTVILKDGREAAVVEAYENKYFIVDVGSSPKAVSYTHLTLPTN